MFKKNLEIGDKLYFVVKTPTSKETKYAMVYLEIININIFISVKCVPAVIYYAQYGNLCVYIAQDRDYPVEEEVYRVINVIDNYKELPQSSFQISRQEAWETVGLNNLFKNIDDLLEKTQCELSNLQILSADEYLKNPVDYEFFVL